MTPTIKIHKRYTFIQGMAIGKEHSVDISTMSDIIGKTTFKGHKGSVLCLAHCNSLLLSGSEDKTARVWDLRTSRTALCLVTEEQVTSVAFAPPTSPQPLAGPFARDTSVYISVDNYVYAYDLRKAAAPILRQEFREVLLETTDEINQISLSCRGDAWVAAPDDSGTVHLTDGRRKRVLRHDSNNLVTSAVFRPKRRDEIASGATDCTVNFWNINKPRLPLLSCVIERDDAGANQLCNPPMVHSLAWSPSGRLLAAGLGDGTCSILQVDSRNLTQVARLRDGHDASVATVVFPNWNTGTSNHVLAHDRLLVSAGTDGAILLWDLGRTVAGDGAMDPKTMFRESMVPLESAVDQVSLNEDASPRIIFGIPHEEKPNWLVCSGNADPVLPSTFFVADTTNDITAYIIPVR